jgi:hypothetical protein
MSDEEGRVTVARRVWFININLNKAHSFLYCVTYGTSSRRDERRGGARALVSVVEPSVRIADEGAPLLPSSRYEERSQRGARAMDWTVKSGTVVVIAVVASGGATQSATRGGDVCHHRAIEQGKIMSHPRSNGTLLREGRPNCPHNDERRRLRRQPAPREVLRAYDRAAASYTPPPQDDDTATRDGGATVWTAVSSQLTFPGRIHVSQRMCVPFAFWASFPPLFLSFN